MDRPDRSFFKKRSRYQSDKNIRVYVIQEKSLPAFVEYAWIISKLTMQAECTKNYRLFTTVEYWIAQFYLIYTITIEFFSNQIYVYM